MRPGIVFTRLPWVNRIRGSRALTHYKPGSMRVDSAAFEVNEDSITVCSAVSVFDGITITPYRGNHHTGRHTIGPNWTL